jgi:hypothetical protein
LKQIDYFLHRKISCPFRFVFLVRDDFKLIPASQRADRPREGGDPENECWIPACAGMSGVGTRFLRIMF